MNNDRQSRESADYATDSHASNPKGEIRSAAPTRPACPVCGAALVEIRMKLVCSVCRTICETCCEGGRG